MDLKGLIGRMTVEEKARQLHPAVPQWNRKFDLRKARPSMSKGVGQMAVVLRWMRPRESAETANAIQSFLINKTRPKLPAIIHDECLHGCMAEGSTIFPQAIGMGATWDPVLVERVATAIGRESGARGVRQALSPTINIARDPRAGRTDETYGEDPHLTSRMAVAFIRGLQSEGVIATPKHFAANFVGDGGRDSNAIHFSERLLREVYFPAFRAAVAEAGAWSLMASYNSINGVPCSGDPWLLTRILRNEWGFRGFVVSDYESVIGMHRAHRVAETREEAARMALEAGLDVELVVPDCFTLIPALVRGGKLAMGTLNRAVERTLRAREWLGLFKNPYVSPEGAARVNDCWSHRELALETARKSLVLLKNRGLLPLGREARRIAVIGPNAAEARTGSYSGFGVRLVSPLEGIHARAGRTVQVHYSRGCGLKDPSRKGFAEAVRAASRADVALMLMGNSAGWGDAFTEGETSDRCDLRLPGVQEDLISAVSAANPRTVVVLVNGSAIAMEEWVDRVPAILECWYPGEEGGTAIAEALWGGVNPGGKLPLTFPKRTGQLPLYYNPKPTGRVYDYHDLRGTQEMFPFGHGLSYTSFDYRGLRIRKARGGVAVSFEVRNTGKRRGDEVVQLYIHDEYSGLSRPLRELKAFKRISLEPGGKETVEFALAEADFRHLDRRLKPVLEPGWFELAAGSSSADIRLKARVSLP